MTRLNWFGVVLGVVIVLGFGFVSIGIAENSKVEVCHFPPGNPANFHTITIGESALNAHLDHGDTVGACCDLDCNDDNVCTADFCLDGVCSTNEPVDCDDTVDCTDDSCDTIAGCLNIPNDLNCPSGQTCDSTVGCIPGDACGGQSGGVCVGDSFGCTLQLTQQTCVSSGCTWCP